jgi:hypothetical protein
MSLDNNHRSCEELNPKRLKILNYTDAQNNTYLVYVISQSDNLSTIYPTDKFIERDCIDSGGALYRVESLNTIVGSISSSILASSINSSTSGSFFTVAKQTSYGYAASASSLTSSGVTEQSTANCITVNEPGHGYREYYFGSSLAPSLYTIVPDPYNYNSRGWILYYYLYKPKVFIETDRVSASTNVSSYKKVAYTYNNWPYDDSIHTNVSSSTYCVDGSGKHDPCGTDNPSDTIVDTYSKNRSGTSTWNEHLLTTRHIYYWHRNITELVPSDINTKGLIMLLFMKE